MSPGWSSEGSEHVLTPEVRVLGEGLIDGLATGELSENVHGADQLTTSIVGP